MVKFMNQQPDLSCRARKRNSWWHNNCEGDGCHQAKVVESEKIKRLDDNDSKVMHASASDYWKEALHHHWPVLIQGLFLVTIIIMLGPWVGRGCSEENDGQDVDQSGGWWSAISRMRQAITSNGLGIRSYRSCYDIRDERTQKRRVSILKRKRTFVNSDDDL